MHELTTPESNSTKNVPIRSAQIASYRDEGEVRAMRFAMRISLAFGVVMLVGKMAAYFMTGSAAILSDAAESVIHVVAVAFAAFSLRLSTKPAAPKFLSGYERIAFFSAGFEGAMIVPAAIFILYTAIEKWLTGNWRTWDREYSWCWRQVSSMPDWAGTWFVRGDAATR